MRLIILAFLFGAMSASYAPAKAEVHLFAYDGSTWAQGQVDRDLYDARKILVNKTVRAGDTVKLCNRGVVLLRPWSLSKYNTFTVSGPGSKLNLLERVLDRGKCISLLAHNPTDDLIEWHIVDEIFSNLILKIAILPSEHSKNLDMLRTGWAEVQGIFPDGCAKTFSNSVNVGAVDNFGTFGDETICRCSGDFRWTRDYSACTEQGDWPDRDDTAQIVSEYFVDCKVPLFNKDDLMDVDYYGQIRFIVDDAGDVSGVMQNHKANAVYKGQKNADNRIKEAEATGAVTKDGKVDVKVDFGELGSFRITGTVILHPSFRTYEGKGKIITQMDNVEGESCTGYWRNTTW
jgi:hypothetical protein